MYCTECGSEIKDEAVVCVHCGVPVGGASGRPAQAAAAAAKEADPSLTWVLPVGRSGYAIAAGYLGLLSVLFVFAPFAVALGILAILDIRQHPEKQGMGRAIFGIVMGSFFTLALLAAVLSAVLAA